MTQPGTATPERTSTPKSPARPVGFRLLTEVMFGAAGSTLSLVYALITTTTALVSIFGYRVFFGVSQPDANKVNLQDLLPSIGLLLAVIVFTSLGVDVGYLLWKRLTRPQKTESVRVELVESSLGALDSSPLNPRNPSSVAMRSAVRG